MQTSDLTKDPWKPPPIDIDFLLNLGQSIPSAGTPAVAALCVRLATHVSELHEGTDIDSVVTWAEQCFEVWSTRLAHSDPLTKGATLETDPGNLILGALALHDRALADFCLSTQLELYERSTNAGVPTLSRLNQSIVSSLLGSQQVVTSSCALANPLTEIELFADLSPVNIAALALSRRNSKRHEVVVLEDEIAAVGMRSVWARDLSGVGLSLLASTLLFGKPVPDGLVNWLRRIVRTNGFFGMWQLFAEHHAKSNLLATVNIYWGLSMCGHSPPDELRPNLPQQASASLSFRQRCRAAIARAQSWLNEHSESFQLLPACRDDQQFETRFKPLVELALLCYVLTRHRHDAVHAPWTSWARSTAERLFAHVEWEGLMETFRLNPSTTLGLAIYPLLMAVVGREPSFAAEAKCLIEDPFAQAQERTPMREMDYQFTRHCMGVLIPSQEVQKQIERTVLRLRFDPLLLDTPALYDVTHIVFYATRFGCVPWSPDSATDDWLRESLNSIMLARFLMHDADLGAEFLLVHFYTEQPLDRITLNCLERLLATQTSEGAFQGPKQESEKMNQFDDNYHTTLVALAALAEAEVKFGSETTTSLY